MKGPLDGTVSDACVPKTLHSLSPSASVAKALQHMRVNGVSSCPIVDGAGKPVAFVDYLDLLAALVAVVTQERASRITPPSHSLHTDDVSMILERGNALLLHSLDEHRAANKSGRNPLVVVAASAPLREAAAHLCRGVHRVAVVDSSGLLVNILSQSDLLRWAHSHQLLQLDNVSASSLASSKELFVVSESEQTIDAFQRLHTAGHYGGGVVNTDGVLVGSFSSSDLRCLVVHDDFLALLTPIFGWMRTLHEDEGTSYFSLSWVGEQATAQTVAKRLVDKRMHRIFVVDPKTMKPRGVITLTDVLMNCLKL